MGFKSRIFGGTLILCALLILDTRNIVNGCQLFNPDGEEVNLSGPPGNVLVPIGAISDNKPPGLLSSFSTVDVNSVSQVLGQGTKYLEYNFTDSTLNILISDSYEDWKRNEDETFNVLSIVLRLDCSQRSIEFRAPINTFTNIYPPEFPETSYNITLPMPLSPGYTIVGECGEMIEVTDFDYRSLDYKSDVIFSLKDTTEDLVVTAIKRDGRKWAVILKTTNTFRIEESLTVTLVATDVPPEGKTDSVLTSEVNITIEPDIAASTPASPLFSEPIYILDIRQEEDIKPVVATLVEGATPDCEVELTHKHGESLKEFFDIDIKGAVVTLTPNEFLASTEFSGNFGVLILEARHPNTSRIGKTVIHVTLPGNYVTPPPTSTTETTMLPCSCPTEETPYTADTTKPTEETTHCPEISSTTEILPCTCTTEETTLTSDTTKPTDESTFITDTTKPTDESTYSTDTTKPTEGSTQCPEVTITTEGTCPTVTCEPEICSCPPTGNCPTEEPSTTSPSTSAPPQEKSIYFTDPQPIVYIYGQQKGYIKKMRAFCIPECNIQYEIVDGPLSSSLIIDRETGDINITENIEKNGHFDVKAIADFDGTNNEKTETVHLSVMTLQLCENGSYWNNTLTVKLVQEELESPYPVEKCDFMDGCECSIAKVVPEKARDYFTDGGEVVLNKSIDREDKELFPDQSNTYIILHLELSCESDEKTIYKFWDKRSQSAIDDIGTIVYDPSRTVTVIQIEDINDNRPEFDITSLTVGYANAKIAHQLLPPYLMKVQATDADFGENAIIKYSLTPDNQFFIHEDTGVIYPVAEAFIYEDTQFKVYASDSVGAGKPLEVKVTILSSDNLLVIKQRGSVLEDVNAVLDKISNITSYNIKLFSAAVIASDTVVNDAVNKKDDDRQLPNFKSMNGSSNSLLQLIIYGLDFEEKPVSYSDILKDLEGATDFTSESWNSTNNCTTYVNELYESSNTGLLTAVIILAVILLLLLVGAGFAYLRYVRSRRNSNDDYYDKILNNSGRSSASEVDGKAVSHVIQEKSNYANEQLSSKTEMIQPSAPLSPQLSTTKPDQEVVNVIAPNEFNQGTADVKNTANNGDGGELQDEKNSEKTVTRKKSVVTFNDNIEQIDPEEV